MELTAGPERRGSLAIERTKSHTPHPHLLASLRARERRGTAWPRRARPGSSSFTHSHASSLGSKPPRTDSIIGTTFFSSSSCRTALWSPSVPFWEMRIQQTQGREASSGAPQDRLHYCPVTKSPELPRTLRTPLSQRRQHAPSSLIPRTCLLHSTFLLPPPSTVVILYLSDCYDPLVITISFPLILHCPQHAIFTVPL